MCKVGVGCPTLQDHAGVLAVGVALVGADDIMILIVPASFSGPVGMICQARMPWAKSIEKKP